MGFLIRFIVFSALFLTSQTFVHAHSVIGDTMALPPVAGYQTFDSPHFQVIFPKNLENLAKETSLYLEEAHSILVPVFAPFDNEPKHTVKVILTDNQDDANGLAVVIGRQGLVILAAPPDPYSSIGEYDNWLRNVVLHEYTHYLTLSPTRGIFSGLQFLFGFSLLPNQLWPSWLSEGVAVFAETYFTKLGRGNGAYYATITRDALARGTLGSDFLKFNAFVGPVPDFPFGGSNYYVGYYLADQLVREFNKMNPDPKAIPGPLGIGLFTYASSGRLPYLMNGTLQSASEELLDRNLTYEESSELRFQKLWERAIEVQKENFASSLKELQTTGTQPITYTEAGAQALGVRASPDGKKLVYAFRSGHALQSLILRNLETEEEKVIANPLAVSPGMAWSTDSKTLYFARSDYSGPFHIYGDLYSWSEDAGFHRLSENARAKDPDYCSTDLGEEFLVFTSVSEGITSIKRLDLKTKIIATLYTPSQGLRVANPRCSFNGKQIFFSMHAQVPKDGIYMISSEVPPNPLVIAPQSILGGKDASFGALYPEPTQDGLLFTKVENGFYDLCFYKERKIKTLAHAQGGFWFPSHSRSSADNRIFVSYLSSQGIQLAELRKGLVHPTDFIEVASAVDKTPNDAGIKSKVEALANDFHSYNLFGSLAPRIWSPFLLLGSDKQNFGAILAGWDDLDLMEYQLQGSYDSIKKGATGSISTNHRLPEGFKLALGAGDDVTSYRVSSGGRRAYFEEKYFLLGLSRPFPKLFSRFTPYLDLEWARLYYGGSFENILFHPEFRIDMGVNYDSRLRTSYALLSEQGFMMNTEVRRYQPVENFTDNGSTKLGFVLQKPWRVWPRHGVLNLSAYFSMSMAAKSDLPESFASLGGQGQARNLNPPLRGYAQGFKRGRKAYVGQGEYHLPLAQIFRGAGLFPFFLKNIGAYALTDIGWLEYSHSEMSRSYIGTGGGMLFNSVIGYIFPFQLKLEFSKGLVRDQGETQFFIGFNL